MRGINRSYGTKRSHSGQFEASVKWCSRIRNYLTFLVLFAVNLNIVSILITYETIRSVSFLYWHLLFQPFIFVRYSWGMHDIRVRTAIQLLTLKIFRKPLRVLGTDVAIPQPGMWLLWFCPLHVFVCLNLIKGDPKKKKNINRFEEKNLS